MAVVGRPKTQIRPFLTERQKGLIFCYMCRNNLEIETKLNYLFSTQNILIQYSGTQQGSLFGNKSTSRRVSSTVQLNGAYLWDKGSTCTELRAYYPLLATSTLASSPFPSMISSSDYLKSSETVVCSLCLFLPPSLFFLGLLASLPVRFALVRLHSHVTFHLPTAQQ